VKAVVLAGGEGTRLAPYTRVLPKPLLPIGDRPILEIIVGQLRDAGLEEIVLATGYLHGLIEAYFGDGSAFGVSITYAREDAPLGTAGPLATIDGLDDTFLLMNGDVLSDLPLRDLLAAHRASGAVATIASHVEDVEIDFGVLRLGRGEGPVRAIESIDEKPRYVLDVSMGVYVFEPPVLAFVEAGRKIDFPDLIAALIGAGEPVNAYKHAGSWVDVGRIHHLEEVAQAMEGSASEVAGRQGADPREELPRRERH
jgi:NDP-sugar pyrophosphorylase family protein